MSLTPQMGPHRRANAGSGGESGGTPRPAGSVPPGANAPPAKKLAADSSAADWSVTAHVGDEQATRSRLADALAGEERPALLFSASHGTGFDSGDPAQREHQGALPCQNRPGPRQWHGELPHDFHFAGEDLGSDATKPITLQGHDGDIGSAVFGPDGRQVLTASRERTLRLRSLARPRSPVISRGHTGRVSSALFYPGGDRIFSASTDGTARIWRADGAGRPIVLGGHESGLWRAIFGPEGRRIVTTPRDETVRIWPFETNWKALTDGFRERTRRVSTWGNGGTSSRRASDGPRPRTPSANGPSAASTRPLASSRAWGTARAQKSPLGPGERRKASELADRR